MLDASGCRAGAVTTGSRIGACRLLDEHIHCDNQSRCIVVSGAPTNVLDSSAPCRYRHVTLSPIVSTPCNVRFVWHNMGIDHILRCVQQLPKFTELHGCLKSTLTSVDGPVSIWLQPLREREVNTTIAQLLETSEAMTEQCVVQFQAVLSVSRLEACSGTDESSIAGDHAEALGKLQASLQNMVQSMSAAYTDDTRQLSQHDRGTDIALFMSFTHALLAATLVLPPERQRLQPFGDWNAWWQTITKLAEHATSATERAPLRSCVTAAILWDVAAASNADPHLVNLSTRPLLALLGMGIERSLGAAAVDAHASNSLLYHLDVLIGALGQVVRYGALFTPQVHTGV